MTGNSGSAAPVFDQPGDTDTVTGIYRSAGDTDNGTHINSQAVETVTSVRSYSPAGDSYIRVRGTSTLHDWEMLSDNVKGEIHLIIGGNGIPGDVEDLVFSLEKTTLRSNQSGLDRRAYDALDAGRHPEITFRMNGPGMVRDNGEGYIISARGDLTVAGETKRINVEAICVNGNDSRLICTGSRTLRMSDFSIDPPVMMLGALRTGDEVTVDYRIELSQ